MTEQLVEQLWGGAVAAGRLRVEQGSRPHPTSPWREVERYYVVPTASSPTMLLPAAPRPALLGALNNYRGLRTVRRQVQRRVLGTAAMLGGLPAPQVVLAVPPDEPQDSRAHPLGELSAALGRHDLRAAIGVRNGANRKATLQLVDTAGAPAGFAKFSWSDQTALAVRREAAALGGDTEVGVCRRPALLTTGDWFGWPYLVSSPLPLESRGVRGRVASPTVQEFHDLAPVTGRRPLAGSGQVRSLLGRLDGLSRQGASAGLVSRATALLDDAQAAGESVVMAVRWHGDLTPWNTARDGDGRLWCWDWESSEPDAVAGLDAIHWHLSLVQEAGRPLDPEALAGAVRAAAPVLTGLGQPREAALVVAAVYVAALVERAVALSVAEGGWEADWLTAEDLDRLVTHAVAQLRDAALTSS